jgi:hypothetical protein
VEGLVVVVDAVLAGDDLLRPCDRERRGEQGPGVGEVPAVLPRELAVGRIEGPRALRVPPPPIHVSRVAIDLEDRRERVVRKQEHVRGRVVRDRVRRAVPVGTDLRAPFLAVEHVFDLPIFVGDEDVFAVELPRAVSDGAVQLLVVPAS